jgi:DNA repair exonuclease SbcCD nuclease subunit
VAPVILAALTCEDAYLSAVRVMVWPVRLLLFSDLHLEAPFAWARPEVAAGRRRALRACLANIIALAASTRVDALVCAGDLYEQDRFTPDTARFVRDCFAQLHPLPVYLAPGNHDWFGPNSLYVQVTWTPNVHVFTADRLQPVTLADGLTLWGAAHRAPAGTRGFLDDFRVDRPGVHLGLFHGSEQGTLTLQESSKIPHAPFRAGQIRAAGLHHAVVGHFHKPRDAAEHTYPGNPEPLTFGETGDRGAVLLTVDAAGGVARARHRVAVSEVSDVEIRVDGVTNGAMLQPVVDAALVDVKGTVRVTLHGELDPAVELDVDTLRRPAHLDAWLVRTGSVNYGYDFEALAREQTVRGQFVRDVQAAELTEDDRRRVLVTGLRAFERRRNDLAVR